MSSTEYDLVVVGGGPGGYVAALRAAQLGLKTACVDDHSQFGGTCLRVGCIPSKALLESSQLYHEVQSSYADHGIQASGVQLDLQRMLARKDDVVNTLTGGINMLLKRAKVKRHVGRGVCKQPGVVEVRSEAGESQTLQTKRILIATGSRPTPIPGVQLDHDRVGTSTAALQYDEVPNRLVVIGAGYIGLELGSVWQRLGAEVHVVEAEKRILLGIDGEIARLAHRILEKQGLRFHLSTRVESAERGAGQSGGDGCIVKIQGGDPIETDRVLLAVGRVPNTAELGLEQLGAKLDRRGFIQVDEDFRAAEGLYAIGDCIGGPMLAHKASEEGMACIERMVSGVGHVDYNSIPAVVYTHPEIAAVGRTEEQLKADDVPYKKGVCPFGANGRARALGDFEGRVKLLAHAETDRLLGVHIIGPRAGDLIAEAAVAMRLGASSEDIIHCSHAHPTLSEAVLEAALALHGRAIHT